MKSHIWMSPRSGSICATLLAAQAEAQVPRFRRFRSAITIARRREEVRKLSGIVASLCTSLYDTPWAEEADAARSRIVRAHAALSAELARRARK